MRVTDEMVEAAAVAYAACADNPDHGVYMPAFRDAITAALSHAAGQEVVGALSRGVPEGMVLVPRSSAEMAAVVCDEWGELFFGTPGLDKYERFTYGPAVEMLRDELRAIAAQRKEGE